MDFNRSSRPTSLPFSPFPFSSGIVSSDRSRNQPVSPRGQGSRSHKLRRQVSSIIIELARLPLRPLVESRHIYQDLTVRRSFDVGSVHGTRRRIRKVDLFAVVATALARAFEFVLAGFPVGRAAQMRAAR